MRDMRYFRATRDLELRAGGPLTETKTGSLSQALRTRWSERANLVSSLSCARTQLFSCGRSSCASRTDASISTRLIETLSTLIPNGTPRVRQYVISSVAVARAC
jgi:hypothetical protein